MKLSYDVTFEENFQKFTRRVAAEGIVLLKNNHNVLPITSTDNVALFGRCQIDYYRSGTGSGGAVNTKYAVNALEGLQNTNINLNKELINRYQSFVQEHPFDKGNGYWASEPWYQTELLLTDDIVKNASVTSNKAIIFIGRTAGEDKDHKLEEGSLLLTKTELQNIEVITRYFNQIALVYNVGNIIDMSYISRFGDKIDSILYAWQGGMEGGNALADVLTGNVNPSGKLPDTIIHDIQNYPTNENFGNTDKNFYVEDIYVGYRYFETFHKSLVLYPFGYGLSYTTFEHKVHGCKRNTKEVIIDIEVINTGATSGKDVVQIYSEAPQGRLGKPAVELVGFHKTQLIQPNESENITIRIPLLYLSSYDDTLSEYTSSYILEKGIYTLYLGRNSRELTLISSYNITETIQLKKLEEALRPLQSFKRIQPGGKISNSEYRINYQDTPLRTVDLQQRILKNLPESLPLTNAIFTFKDVINKTISLDTFISSLSKEQLSLIVIGEGMSHPLVTPGTAAAFGGIYPLTIEKEIPASCAADGPSGLRMDTGDTATQMPIGTLIASTWDTSLIEELYTFEGQELKMHHVDTLLGPGMNIHRNPMCGRNFEYFSEDPLLTGKMAAAIVRGLRKGGSEATLKHFAANDQETSRFDVDSIASERCLREIHLKAFEIAVKESQPISIMTAYNPVNGHQSASNYDLVTTVLRNEWKFDGMVMTDWWAQMNHNSTPDKAERFRLAEMIKSQNDLYMVVPNGETPGSKHYQNILSNLETGFLTLGELQRSVKNILAFILKTNAINRLPKSTINIKTFQPLDDVTFTKNKYTNSIRFYLKVSGMNWISVTEDGIYTVSVSMRNANSELSQSACNICINDNLLENVQLNGNNNTVVTRDIAKIKLSKGLYKVSLDFTKPGLEITNISFKIE